jgi:GAF domain-containing protein
MTDRPRISSTHPKIVFRFLAFLSALSLTAVIGLHLADPNHQNSAAQEGAGGRQITAPAEYQRPSTSTKVLAAATAPRLTSPGLLTAADGTMWVLPAILIGAILVFALAGLVSFVLLNRQTTIAIQKLKLHVNRLASGNLDERADTSRDDAVASLGAAVDQMVAALLARSGAVEQQSYTKNLAAEETIRQLQAALVISAGLQAPTALANTLENTAQLLCDQLGCSHVGIYLLEGKMLTPQLRAQAGQTAAGQAAAGQTAAEQANVDEQRGPNELVAAVIASGETQTQRRSERNLSSQSSLPTQSESELALPLKVGQDLIGVIDLFSTQTGAFSESATLALKIISEQIALAVQKAKHIALLEHSVQELQSSYRQFTQDEWLEFLRNQKESYALRLRAAQIEANPPMSPESMLSIAENKTILAANQPNAAQGGPLSSSLAVPIQVRGQTIGTLNIQFKTGKVTSETVQLVENIVDRLAGALENARLLEVIEKRAERERRLAEITARVRASASIDQILITALGEISRGLGVSNAVIQLGDLTENETEGKW